MIGTSDQPCWLAEACKLLLLVQDHGVREELLIHIAKEATAVRDAGWRALKVVSDIDDTFLCSGGSFPSGVVALSANAVLLLESRQAGLEEEVLL